MSTLNISEAGSVQFPMVEHAAEIGWVRLTPQEAEALRHSRANMLFTSVLETKLLEFNPWLTEDQARSIVETIEALPPTIDGNWEVLRWLRGERMWPDQTELRDRPVQLIDYDHPGNNALHVTWEWKIEPVARKGNRADVMFVVNGIPVTIVEHKNPTVSDALERAIKQLRRYEVETPELIAQAQLHTETQLIDYWYGVTWNVTRRATFRWKHELGGAYREAVQTFFEPYDFLRTLRRWILVYVEDGETRKSVLREHQRRAVDKIVERCADPAKTRGLIWHTQGSGKTFTLLTAARQILEDKTRFANATVVLVVDRTELEGQLKEWVDRLLGEMQQSDIAVRRAESKDDLQDILYSDYRGLVVSMIHKFEEIKADSSTRDNIFIFIDEAHRSVAADLGSYLMAAAPNATIVGFTGTPVGDMATGSGSFRVFGSQDEGGYLDKYSILESIEDETTLPIKYKMAPSTMMVPADTLDQQFFDLAADEAVTDVEELNAVLDRAVGLRILLGADDRVEQVAAFVAEHFRENVDPLGYKAFLVAVDRETCAKYKRALDKQLPPEWSEVVYSKNANDIVDRPDVARLQLSDEREKEVRKSFKKADQQPKILIVTDKLLTGYDAPVLYAMYLDKPMRSHVLLQALARVNRPYVDDEGISKPVGIVVDFVGVLRELKKALSLDSGEIGNALQDLDVLLPDLLVKIDAAAKEYLEVDGSLTRDAQLESVVYGRFLTQESRQAFYKVYREIEGLWEILSPDAALRGHIQTYKHLSQLYAAVRAAYSESLGFLADLEYKTKRLLSDSVTQQDLGRFSRVVTFDVPALQSLREEGGAPEGKVHNLLRGLRQEVQENPALAAVLQGIQERADRVLQDLEDRKTDGLAALDQLAALAAEKAAIRKQADESGLTDAGFAVFWVLSHGSTASGFDPIGAAREVEAVLGKFPNWQENPDEKRRLRASLYKPLLTLDAAMRTAAIDEVMQVIEHGAA